MIMCICIASCVLMKIVLLYTENEMISAYFLGEGMCFLDEHYK